MKATQTATQIILHAEDKEIIKPIQKLHGTNFSATVRFIIRDWAKKEDERTRLPNTKSN